MKLQLRNFSSKYAEVQWKCREEDSCAKLVISAKTTVNYTTTFVDGKEHIFKARPREGDITMTVNEMSSLSMVPSRGLELVINIHHLREDEEIKKKNCRSRSVSRARPY